MVMHRMDARRAAAGSAALVVLGGALLSACGGGGGGGGGSAPSGSSTAWTLVAQDPAGGRIEESTDGAQRRIFGTFSLDVTLTNTHTWLIDAPTFMGQESTSTAPVTGGPTLTIPAGTTLLGRGGTPPSMLVIRRGAKIEAAGTPSQPIVFTSVQPAGLRAPGQWGGIVINGNAPVNDTNNGTALPLGEGASGPYGSVPGVADDDSGTLRYVRIEYAGHIFTADDELNGLALQGVGSGTTVEFVQIHKAADDGVELFGGTVDVKNLVVTGALDDSIDWTGGWTGRMQFVVAQQHALGADNGIEADNLEANNNALPRSSPTLANLSLVGPGTITAGVSTNGLLLRRGTRARLVNSIVMNFRVGGLDIDSNATWDQAYADNSSNGATFASLSGGLLVEETLFFNNGSDGSGHFVNDGGEPQTVSSFNAHIAASAFVDNVITTTPPLVAPTSTASPDWRAAPAGPATGAVWAGPTGDAFFTQTDYRGAMDAATNWASGWTTTAEN
jgi:hypothetical protein